MRLYLVLDEDTIRALRWRALDGRRSLRDQAAWELERALVDVYRPEGPPPHGPGRARTRPDQEQGGRR